MKSIIFLFVLCTSMVFAKGPATSTPIKHLVVIFQENRTFDNYFGTYPYAENNPGEMTFRRRRNTPTVNGLTQSLLTENPNLANPFRLSPAQALTCSPAHRYKALQAACALGLMDHFVQENGTTCPGSEATCMGYYDGNTVAALWYYAQYFSMSDNFHSTTMGPSTIGAINLISGNTHGANPANIAGERVVDGTILNNTDPLYDNYSTAPLVELMGINIGNLLNAKGITWGWFAGGFRNPTATHISPSGVPELDYVVYINPFQFYQSTSNPAHLPPSSPKMIGKTDQANHLYDLEDFWAAAESGRLPSVSFLRAPVFLNGHPLMSTSLLEQTFLVNTINKLQTLKEWKDMAIIITYDDSGGWYDHEVPPIINQSHIAGQDSFADGANAPLGGYQGRPAYGLRVPCIVISPWAKVNYVDSTLTDQTSILRFIEDNWYLGRIGDFSFDAFAGPLTHMFNFKERNTRYLMLNPNTGEILYHSDVN